MSEEPASQTPNLRKVEEPELTPTVTQAPAPIPPPAAEAPEPSMPGRLYLDCIDPETKKPARIVLPTKFPVLAKELQATLDKRPELKNQPATILTYVPVPNPTGKSTIREQKIVAGPFCKVLEWVQARILSKEDAAQAIMQSLAGIANASRLKMVTITILDEENGQAVSGGFTMQFVPEEQFTNGELTQHYGAAVGHAEEFRGSVEKTRGIVLGDKLIKPGDVGFQMPRRFK